MHTQMSTSIASTSILSSQEEARARDGGFYVSLDHDIVHDIPAYLADELAEFETEGMDRLVEMLGETLDDDNTADEVGRYVEVLQSYLDVLETAVLQDMPDADALLSLVEKRIREAQVLAQTKTTEEEDDSDEDV